MGKFLGSEKIHTCSGMSWDVHRMLKVYNVMGCNGVVFVRSTGEDD